MQYQDSKRLRSSIQGLLRPRLGIYGPFYQTVLAKQVTSSSLCLVLYGTSILVSIVAVPFSIPTTVILPNRNKLTGVENKLMVSRG